MCNCSEKDIEDFLFDNPGLVDVDRWIGRQIRLDYDDTSCYGRLDLLGISFTKYGYPMFKVFEVKNTTIKRQDICQVSTYAFYIKWVGHIILNELEDLGYLMNYEEYAEYSVDKFLFARGPIDDNMKIDLSSSSVHGYLFYGCHKNIDWYNIDGLNDFIKFHPGSYCQDNRLQLCMKSIIGKNAIHREAV